MDAEYHPPSVKHPRFHGKRDDVFDSYWWLSAFGVLPEAGGLNDQDAFWKADMELCHRLKMQTQQEYIEWVKANGRTNA